MSITKSMRVAASMAALVLLAGCGGGSGGDASPSPVTIEASTDPLSNEGFIWASGSTVHLADGSTIDTYVVAGDGIFFIPAQKGPDTEERPAPTVRFADRDSNVTDTGLNITVPSFTSSPDGRYLGGLDFVTGRKDGYGTPQAHSVVVDLATGKQILDTPRAMGDPDADDFAIDYNEGVFPPPRFTNTSATFVAEDDTFTYTYSTDTLASVPESDQPLPPLPQDDELLVSPDQKWRIKKGGLQDTFVASDGQEVTPQPGTSGWLLDRWIDDSTVVGATINGPIEGDEVGPRNSNDLMTCTIPSGECDVIKGTAGSRIVFPAGTLPFAEETLKDVDSSDD